MRIFSDRFARVVAANTGLPTGEGIPSDAFLNWRQFVQEVPEFEIGTVVQQFTLTELDAAVVAAYNAPFPGEAYKAGARQFPMLVPTIPDATRLPLPIVRPGRCSRRGTSPSSQPSAIWILPSREATTICSK